MASAGPAPTADAKGIPSSTNVSESTVLSFGIDQVWSLVSTLDFAYAADVESVKYSDDRFSVGGTVTFTYTDGTSQTCQIIELSELYHFVTFRLVASEPAVSYTSAVHKLQLYDVTVPSGAEAQTYVVWSSDFSNDASVEVVEDSRFKKRDGFKAMAAKLAA